MLSTADGFQSSSGPTLGSGMLSIPLSALLFDDSPVDMMDFNSEDRDQFSHFVDDSSDPMTPLLQRMATQASPYSEHTTLSRTSSDEGCSNSATASYTQPSGETDNLFTTISFQLNELQGFVRDPVVEEFPYEDVLALEKALNEAVGDIYRGTNSTEKHNSTNEEPNQQSEVVSPDNSDLHSLVNVSENAIPQASPILFPGMCNTTPKVSHRVVVSPKTTLVLCDDVKLKKFRPVVASRETIGDSSETLRSASSENERFQTFSYFPTTSHSPSVAGEASQDIDKSCEPGNSTREEAGQKSTQNQPLPPEGYKISRYPMDEPDSVDNESQVLLTKSEEIKELRYQYHRARMEVTLRSKELASWKKAAQSTFEAARKIRAQMELERSRADRAERRISKLSAHFKLKAAAKARARSADAEKVSSFASLINPSSDATRSDDDNIETKKRRSHQPERLSKRRRTTTGLDDVTKSLASWLMTSQISNKQVDSSSKSTSDNPFGANKQKGSLVYAPQINSGVRLALRAKVCSARADTIKSASELLEQTNALLADLPTIPQTSKSSDSMLSATPSSEIPETKKLSQNL